MEKVAYAYWGSRTKSKYGANNKEKSNSNHARYFSQETEHPVTTAASCNFWQVYFGTTTDAWELMEE